MGKEITTEDIIEGCRKGQPIYQRALVNRYGERLFALCLRYVKDRGVAEDMLQESLLSIFKFINGYDASKSSLYTWMSVISVRICIKNLKKRKLSFVSYDEMLTEQKSFDPTPLDELSTKELVALVNQLPDGYSEVFNLAVNDGFSHKEIGELLGLSSTASRSRLARAKEMLKKKIRLLQKKESWTNIS